MITKDAAIQLLVDLFNSNNLSFRDISKIKQVFNEAVEVCNESRSEDEADYLMGRSGQPSLPSKDTEDDFFYNLEVKAEQSLLKRGIKPSSRAIEAIVDFAYDEAEYEIKDFYKN